MKLDEITEKTGRLVAMLCANLYGGVLLNAQHNFAWLTGGGTNAVDTSCEQGVCALLIRRDGKRFVLASRIEMTRLLDEELTGKDFEPIEFSWEEEKSSPTFLCDRAQTLLEKDTVLGCDLPLSANVSVIENHIAGCRYQLTATEMERFRLLGHDAGQAVGDLARALSPGETEKEVARRVADALATRGISAVVNLIAADERVQKYRHPVPTNKSWTKVLMIVVCARRAGLIASLTRIVCAGVVTDELRQRTIAAARVNARLLAATRPDVTGAELYETAARAYRDEGFPGEERLHHQGGAAGYRPRDWVAHPSCLETVRGGQAFAWNPSITGTKVEETVIFSADGIEVITATPDWPQIGVAVDGREYAAPDVLSI